MEKQMRLVLQLRSPYGIRIKEGKIIIRLFVKLLNTIERLSSCKRKMSRFEANVYIRAKCEIQVRARDVYFSVILRRGGCFILLAFRPVSRILKKKRKNHSTT